MSKIFVIKILMLYSIIPFAQQTVIIKHLNHEINTVGSELNFLQIDETNAFYTSSTQESENYQSLIFKTHLKNGEWRKGQYVNLGNSFSFANISYKKNALYFSVCDEFNVCRIGIRENINSPTKILNNRINLANFTNTQPHATTHQNKNVLYFVSNREGGFGGMDIWFCIIDNLGNYGQPINAGKKINTKYNEVTPFYNIWSEELFFSSDRENQKSDFNIYKSNGRFNLWESPLLVSELNSTKDDLYISFYDEFHGYFSSNRAPSLFENKENCCNDIFSFKYIKERDTSYNFNDTINNYLPIKLYFHNDEPDNNSKKKTTSKTYKDCYISYYLQKDKYMQINPLKKIDLFFEQELKRNYNKLNYLLKYLLRSLQNEEVVELYVKGFASPLYNDEYNIYLSQRRIYSLKNMLMMFENGALISYLENGALTIIELPYGESKSKKNVSDNPKNKKKSIYSIDAMLERKIEIIKIIKF